jgi:hypothetical protein
MLMTDYTELKQLAEAASPGPWLHENDDLYFKDDGYTRHMMTTDPGHDVCDEAGDDAAHRDNLKFIAAANPAAVLALVAEIQRLHQALREITAEVDGNIRPTVRDCVNGQNNVQDIYGYCDKIGLIAAAVMKEPQP